MNVNTFCILLPFCLFTHIIYSEEILDDSFSIKATLDNTWKYDSIDSVTRFLYDDSRFFKSYIYIEKIPINESIVLEDDEYAQMYFLTNLSIAKQFGTVQYYDTSTSIKQGTVRAYELFAFYYKDTTNGMRITWAELGRWSKKGKHIYQITVLGDTTDIVNNLSQYQNIINLIHITDHCKNIHFRHRFTYTPKENYPCIYINLKGQKTVGFSYNKLSQKSHGLYISSRKRKLLIISR